MSATIRNAIAEIVGPETSRSLIPRRFSSAFISAVVNDSMRAWLGYRWDKLEGSNGGEFGITRTFQPRTVESQGAA